MKEALNRGGLISGAARLTSPAIGDAFIVVAGLPELRSDHAQSAIEMAMAMQCHLETMWAEHPELRLRIGIHTGPVVAGVIGEDKFT
jgi:adenylate cyclase